MYDYAGGKADWMAAGLPVEGDGPDGPPPAMELVRTDVATCRLDDRVGDVRGRLDDPDVPFVIVVDGHGHVLGKARGRDLESARDDAQVSELLVEGPTTTRADVDPGEMLHRMEHARTGSILITTGQGELIGVLLADDLERELHGHG